MCGGQVTAPRLKCDLPTSISKSTTVDKRFGLIIYAAARDQLCLDISARQKTAVTETKAHLMPQLTDDECVLSYSFCCPHVALNSREASVAWI